MSYSLTTKIPWSETKNALVESLRKWGVKNYELECDARMYGSWGQSLEQRTVKLRVIWPDGHELNWAYNLHELAEAQAVRTTLTLTLNSAEVEIKRQRDGWDATIEEKIAAETALAAALEREKAFIAAAEEADRYISDDEMRVSADTPFMVMLKAALQQQEAESK